MLSPEQGVFNIWNEDYDYYYVADKASNSIGIYTIDKIEAGVYRLNLVTKRYYDSDVSFQLATSYDSLTAENDFGLTSDLVTVTIDSNTSTLTIPDLQGKKGAVYKDEKGETR